MIAVADLLSTRSLALTLLTGDPATPLSWVATSELEDPSPFLEGGELLLTTGLRTPAEAGWRTWVEHLVGARVSAVGFGVGLSHERVPPALVAAAAGSGLVVLEVPTPTSFIAVSRRVAELLRRQENDADLEAARTQRALADDAAHADGQARVLHRVARSLDGAAWLLGARGGVLAASTDEAPPAETADALDRVRARGARAAFTDVDPTRTLLLRAVGDDPPTWLLVRAAPDQPRAAQAVVGTAAALLNVLGRRGDAVGRREDRVLACVLDLVLAPSGEHLDLGRRMLAALGLKLPDPLVVVRVEGGRAPGPLSDGHRAVLSPPVTLTDLDPGSRVGISRVVPAGAAADALASAEAALARTDAERPVVDGADLRGAGLAGLLGIAGAREHARTLLAPLAAAGREEATLRETLRVFLARHGQIQATADELGVHRNTVRARLARVEALLGTSLDSPDDRAELWMALRS
ncbi:helix-turn-helix domain-containing protein [Kineococcus gynurae]|uniref:Helix-turn-helix domain-containing protein n=1 Tax=Kineococcus gynurae TaxID=452979 RepID=A0ABV5LVJ0_9ACTN